MAMVLLVLRMCVEQMETYFNTAALMSCVQNFPKSRGPVMGILKGLAGLTGAILTQIHALINSPNNAAIIFVVALGPSMVVIALMFIADLLEVSQISSLSDQRPPEEETLFPGSTGQDPEKSNQDVNEVIFSEVEEKKPRGVDLLPSVERQKRIAQLQLASNIIPCCC